MNVYPMYGDVSNLKHMLMNTSTETISFVHNISTSRILKIALETSLMNHSANNLKMFVSALKASNKFVLTKIVKKSFVWKIESFLVTQSICNTFMVGENIKM